MSIIGRNIREMPKSTMSKFLEHNRLKPNRMPSLSMSLIIYALCKVIMICYIQSEITVADFYTYKYTRELAMDCRHFTNLKLVYVTRQGKTELVCAIYTSSHSTYLTFCVRYTSSVNCINFHTVGCTSCKSFIDKIMFRHKVVKLPNSKKWSNFKCT